jgi:hypothetical protein
MLNLIKELIAMIVGVCVIYIFATFYFRLEEAEKEGKKFNPMSEGAKVVREAAESIWVGWNDTTKVK